MCRNLFSPLSLSSELFADIRQSVKSYGGFSWFHRGFLMREVWVLSTCLHRPICLIFISVCQISVAEVQEMSRIVHSLMVKTDFSLNLFAITSNKLSNCRVYLVWFTRIRLHEISSHIIPWFLINTICRKRKKLEQKNGKLNKCWKICKIGCGFKSDKLCIGVREKY